ncbi:hypothetical protein HPB50_012879 [Hyalomma asiaticum]|uniref:Uncharacterized protein n=1 Tax=Hyalomma asiaticum TaxID=266040 RepID=A0ACB7RVZ8_HYAAI|nr:hypothetical protein HPB50_012879 [Hyalomma asiaticum]
MFSQGQPNVVSAPHRSAGSTSESAEGHCTAAQQPPLMTPASKGSSGVSSGALVETDGSKARADTQKVVLKNSEGTLSVVSSTRSTPSVNSPLSRTASNSSNKCASPTGHTVTSGQRNESVVGSHLPASLTACGELCMRKPSSVACSSTLPAPRNVTNSGALVTRDKIGTPVVLDNSTALPSSTLTVSSKPGTVCRDKEMALPHSNLRASVLRSGSVPSSTDGLPLHSVSEKQLCVPAASSPDTTASSDVQLVMCECKFGPVDQGTLERHIMTAHVKPFSHSCELCDRKFPTRKELRDHVTCHIHTYKAAEPERPRDIPQGSESVSLTPECDSLSGENDRDLPRSSFNAGEDDRAREKQPLDDDAAGKGYQWLLRPDLVGSDCLLAFFKCTVGQCRFTANQASDFSNHLASHRLKELGDLVCIYCGEKFDAISILVQHMEGAHRHMVFQCGHCLYRSVLPIHVQLHHKWSHTGQELLLFACRNPVRRAALSDVPTQRVSLTHYWCSAPNCNFKSFNPDVFEWHLSSSHPKAREYTCSICDTSAGSPRELVQHHCVDHGMDVVQCGICHHSEPTCERMLRHLSDHHPDSPLGLICRTNQLVDEFEKCVQSFQGLGEQPTVGARSALEPAKLAICAAAAPLAVSPVRQPSARTPAVKTCPFCTHRVVTLAELANHCVAAHQINLRISETLELMLKKHCASMSKERCLTCPFCNTTFPSKDALQEHMYYEFHYMPIQCEACSYATSNRTHLKEHFSSSHPEKYPAFTICENEDFESWVTNFVSQQEARRIVIEKPYQCVHCPVRFHSTEELRLHLYTHLKYYPYHCCICDECFVSQKEVEEHQRKTHNIAGQYSTKEVRFETKEMKIDNFIEAATEKLQELLGSSTSQQCLWKECSYESPVQSSRVVHMKVHIRQRSTCTRCQFSSYSADVIAWHSKEQHSPVSSSTENPSCSEVQPVPKSNSRLFACGLCSYRGPNTMSIRQHSKVAHPGKAVKLVVPKRKDLLSPAVKTIEAPGRPKDEDCEERMFVSLKRRKKDATCITRWSLKKEKCLCDQCDFKASAEHLLQIHKSNFHGDGQSLDVSTDDVANALSNALALATRRYSTPASTISHRSSQPACQLNTSAPNSPQSNYAYDCRKCSLQFQSRTSFFNHMVRKHCTYAVCDTCGTGLMNNAQAINHCKKHMPVRSTFTALRSRHLASSPPKKLSSSIPRTERLLASDGELYVVAPWAPDDRVPLREFSLKHNLDVHVLVRDFAKFLDHNF